jgi:NosR/NirI family transcriptional regulator, nitrous oxide reductase regulator
LETGTNTFLIRFTDTAAAVIEITLKLAAVFFVCFVIHKLQPSGESGSAAHSDIRTGPRSDVHISQIRRTLPEADSFEPPQPQWSTIYDEQEEVIGYYVVTSPWCDNFRGYAGPLPLLIISDTHKVILSTDTLPNSETPSFIDMMRRKNFFQSWNGMSSSQAAEHEAAAVTGATISCRAAGRSLQKRLAMLAGMEPPAKSAQVSLKCGLSLAFLPVALIFFLARAKLASLRIILLLLSVSILGFHGGHMLSVSVIFGWIAHPAVEGICSTVLIMAIISLLAGFLTGRNIYCNYICPFGAAQELAAKLNRHKPPIPARISKLMPLCKRLMISLAILLAAFTGAEHLNLIEPFSAFSFAIAGRWILTMAAIFLILSAFFPRLWCRAFCPTGTLLTFLKRRRFRGRIQAEKISARGPAERI